jgi:hypothetical protein
MEMIMPPLSGDFPADKAAVSSRVLALKSYREGMQFRCHQSSHDSRIAFHEGASGCFIRCLKNRDAESFVTGFFGAASQD